MIQGKAPRVWFDGEERQRILDLRTGAASAEQYMQWRDKLVEQVKGLDQNPNAVIPDQTVHTVPQAWLLSLRMASVHPHPHPWLQTSSATLEHGININLVVTISSDDDIHVSLL